MSVFWAEMQGKRQRLKLDTHRVLRVKEMGNVEIRYSNLAPGSGGLGGSAAPGSMLPAYTAQSIHEIFGEAIQGTQGLRSASRS